MSDCKSKKCKCPPGPTGATGPKGATGAQGNTGADGATGAPAPSLSARVFNSVVQNIPPALTTTLTFDSERFDDGFHDNAVNNSRLTVPPGGAGKYQITGQARISTPGSDTGLRALFVRLNGGIIAIAVSTVTAAGLEEVDMNVTTLYDLVVGDFIELRATQTSGVAGFIQAVNDFTPDFMLVRVG